jgi:hypothetical protein
MPQILNKQMSWPIIHETFGTGIVCLAGAAENGNLNEICVRKAAT